MVFGEPDVLVRKLSARYLTGVRPSVREIPHNREFTCIRGVSDNFEPPILNRPEVQARLTRPKFSVWPVRHPRYLTAQPDLMALVQTPAHGKIG